MCQDSIADMTSAPLFPSHATENATEGDVFKEATLVRF